MIFSICLVILIGGIRLCLTHLFIDLEYGLPSFPDDRYGFSMDNRTDYAYQSVDYLLGKLNDAEYKALTFPDGKALFNERELSHMADVRDLTQIVLRIWYVSIVVLVCGILLAAPFHLKSTLLKAGKIAGIILFSFIILVILSVILNFDQLFTSFHTLFFKGDSWLFYPDDSLIRLFPTPFWINVFVAVGIFSFTVSFILYFICGWALKNKKEEV